MERAKYLLMSSLDTAFSFPIVNNICPISEYLNLDMSTLEEVFLKKRSCVTE